jgi:glycosyltransferase involved in cell wall biosynthesis
MNDSRILVINNNNNIRLSKCLNHGIEISDSKYIARMDADDISAPTRFEKQLRFMEKNEDHIIVGFNIDIVDINGKIISERLYKESDIKIKENFLKYSPFCHPSILIRKSALGNNIRFNSIMNPAEDYDLFFNLLKIGKFHNLQEKLFMYRFVENSMTNSNTAAMEKITLIIKDKYIRKYNTNWYTKLIIKLHKICIYITPVSFRIKIFNILRKYA